MKAIAIYGYGGDEKLQCCELTRPRPKPGEMLLRVRAAAVNPLDWKIAEGQLRLFVRNAFPYVPGSDLAGEVVEVGSPDSGFAPGDEAVAFLDPQRGGGYAEFALCRTTAAARKPASVGFAEASTLPIAGCTALQTLRDLGAIKEGGSVLILGAAGGVGHFAVQIAKALGARVTASCSAAHVDFVKGLGADMVLDRERDGREALRHRYDLIFDTPSKSSFSECRDALNPGGAYVATLPSADLAFWMAAQSLIGVFAPAPRARLVMVRPTRADLEYLLVLIANGKLRPVVGERFPLEQAQAAQRLSREGHMRGKIVLEPKYS
jgi:NADPH:quinone reductase-like Zn-dependent oxidoreductase